MIKKNVSQKLIANNLVSSSMKLGEEIAIKIQQTLTQDATGTMVMLELEAMGLDKVKTEVSCQYVDHNLVQNDSKNADDHLFLMSCKKFGLHFSRAGNGVSHPVHMENLANLARQCLVRTVTLVLVGSLGMLAIGTGGLEVAMAMAGEPFYFNMPKVMGVKLTGKLQPWVMPKT